PNYQGPIEVRNCEFTDGVLVRALNVRVDNCVLQLLALMADAEGTLECRRCCFWTRDAIRMDHSSIVRNGSGQLQIHVTDSLFESDYLLAAGEVTWQGERNLYRTHSILWGTFTMPDGKPEAWRRTLD